MATVLYNPTPTTIGQLVLDAALSVNHKSDVEVTDHEVEEGANVVDHARSKPDEVTIEGLISDTPISRVQQTRTLDARGITFASSALEDSPQGAPGYAASGYAILNLIKESHQLVTLVTPLRAYKNMMMTSLVVPKDSKTGDALKFTAVFKQVRLVALRRAVVKQKREPKANKKKNDGKQVAKPDGFDFNKSWLDQGVKAIAGGEVFKNAKEQKGRGF